MTEMPIKNFCYRVSVLADNSNDPKVKRLLNDVDTADGFAEAIRDGNGLEGREHYAGMLPNTESLTMLYGPSACGKSFVALDLAARILLGQPFGGEAYLEHERDFAVYVAGEDSYGVLRRAAALSQAGKAPGADRLIVFGAEGLNVANDSVALATAIRAASRVPLDADGYPHYHEAGVVIFDHLTALSGGDGLDSDGTAEKTIAGILTVARELNCPAVVIHHTGRDASRGWRGSQVLFDRADAVWEIRPGRDGIQALNVRKYRQGRPGQGFTYRLVPTQVAFWPDDPDAAKLETCFVEYGPARRGGGAEPARSLPPRAERALAALEGGLAGGLTESTARGMLEKAGVITGSPDAKRMAFKRAIDELEAAGVLTRANGRLLPSAGEHPNPNTEHP